MMRSFAFVICAACLALAGTGCSRSPRVTFYTLEPAASRAAVAPALPPGSGATAATHAPAAPAATAANRAAASAANPAGAEKAAAPAPLTAESAFVVGPVTLPELVDRPQLVVRVAANRVDILETQRWAEPLRSEIPRVIAEDLGRLLGSDRVSSYLQHAGIKPDCRVLLDIQRFEATPGEGVSVEALWSLRRGAGSTPRTGRTQVREAVAAGEGYDGLVVAYGRALLAVAADLAQAIRAESAAGH